MKKSLHPTMENLTVTLSNGTKYQTMWTGNKADIILHADPFNHPAWTGETKLNTSNERVAAFNKRFGK